MWPSPERTRVVFDMKETPKFSYFSLKNPERFVVDFKSTVDKTALEKLKNSSDLIKRVRYSKPKYKGSTRVVFDLKEVVQPIVFALAPTAPYGDRLVVDFMKEAPEEVITRGMDTERNVIIAIDAGHGGEDPGSIGHNGVYEKRVTLSVAKRLTALLNQQKGFEAFMVRTGDYYVNLNRRTDIARKRKADLFVSIHADAFTSPQPRGAAVWVLSLRRANSEIGKWIEQREKHSELLGGAAEVIKDTQNEKYLARTLLDMSMDHSITTSYEVADEVLKSLKGVTRLHNRKPQAASLAVLKSPDIPSILVEIGFMSNPREAKNLASRKYQYRLAGAINQSIQRYFIKSPPAGTLLTKLKLRQHKVRSGESLSKLAQRYNVSVGKIKHANNLKSDLLYIGQVLDIPHS
nr:N-acetylmuramoyl-L-alanine amidase [Algicola sagamiensis]